MPRRDPGPACAAAGPVLAGILAARPAEDVLRCAFAEAQRRDVALHVLLAGPASAAGEEILVRDLVDRWAEKYPAVPVTVSVRHDVDAAITLTGASRRCGLVVVAEPADSHDAAVVQALSRRARCPLMIVAPDHGHGAVLSA
jgi:hypothetical protein